MLLSTGPKLPVVSIEERTRRRVEAELDRLESTYGSFDVHETSWSVPPDRYERIRERAEAGTVGAAGVWLTNPAGEVLLVSDADRDGWSEPAGKDEPGERLEETALRETREETGVECEITGVALAHVVEALPPGVSPQPLTRLIVAFRGIYRGGTPRPRDDDITAVKWWSEHPERLVYDGLAEIDIPASET